MRRIREADIVPPSRQNASCPPELDRVILNALERDPDRRLPSAAAFRTALDNLAARAGLQASARSVAEWMSQFTQPGDSWAGSSPSGRKLPLPPEPPTSMSRPGSSQTSARLRRSTEDARLAAEIWGDEIATSAARPIGPDFSHRVSTPAPPEAPPPVMAATVAIPPHQLPASPSTVQAPVPDLRSTRKTPWIVLAILALIAASLGVYLIVQRTGGDHTVPAPAPATAAITFVVDPADAIVEIGGKVSPAHAELGAGVYSIMVSKDGYRRWATSLGVRVGEPQTINVKLEPEEVAIATPPEPRPDVTKTPPTKVPPTPPAKKDPPTKKEPRVRDREPRAPDPTPDPTPITVAKPDPTPPIVVAKPDPPPPVTPAKPDKPARTPVVAAAAVTKLSGEIPTIKASGGESNGDVLVKMCLDEAGRVTSVKIVKSTADVADELQRALGSWRYKPYLNADQKPSAVCFPLSLRLVFKRPD
jgi:outer membrane biosynthesis protein TonB